MYVGQDVGRLVYHDNSHALIIFFPLLFYHSENM